MGVAQGFAAVQTEQSSGAEDKNDTPEALYKGPVAE